MNELKNMIWQEKYRPTSVKNVISPFTEQILNAMKNPKAMQNFILYSRMGGTGKTSMSKAIVNDLQCDVLNLNASDERSIETIRTKVKDFMVMQSSNENSKKCIIMDEGEKLTKDAADALKNMMEEYSSNSFVILTTNNIHKIPEPLQTRFKIFEFIQPQKNKIYTYLEQICRDENLSFTEDGLKKVIDINYPSIRKMVNLLQDLKNQNSQVHPDVILKDNSLLNNIWELIKKQNYKEVKQEIISKGVDCEELNKFIFDDVIGGDLPLMKEIKFTQLLAKNERDMKLGADKIITFIASLPDMIKIIRLENASNN
jgi:replication factor C small subunit